MKLTGREVVKVVSDYYRVTLADMAGPCRAIAYARPRQVAMYLMHRHCPHLGKPAIGRILGGRDHTTILHGIRIIEKLMRDNVDLSQDIHFLSRRLGAMAPDTLWQARIIAAERHLTALYQAQAEDATRLSA